MAPSKSRTPARIGASSSVSRRARSHRHDGYDYESRSRPPRTKPVSTRSVNWRDGQIDSDHDQTPSKLHQPRSGTGEASHRHRSPERSNISGPAKQLQTELEDDDLSEGSLHGSDSTISGQEIVTPDPNAPRHRKRGVPIEEDEPVIEKGARGKRGQSGVADRTPGRSAVQTKPTPKAPSTTRPTKKSKMSGHANDTGEDRERCIEMQEIVRALDALVQDIPPAAPTFFRDLLAKPENAQLVRYIGCLAIGGSKGEAGWQELVSDQACRKALVVGIVGRALKEHVFGSLWFGATADQLKQLEDMERSSQMVDKDGVLALSSLDWSSELTSLTGFSRTRKRAEVVKGFSPGQDDLEFAINKLNLQLSAMLALFWNEQSRVPATQHWKLNKIVRKAANVSRTMRQQEDVVYYWPPTFKDEEFEPGRMECYNLNDMISHSPYDKKKIQGSFERATLREGEEHRSEAIVRVVCFPGLVAYRQYGGDLAIEEIKADDRENSYAPEDVRRSRMRYGEKLDANNGFRSRAICKSLVQLQWGKQRLLTREAGTSAHIDAVKSGNMKKYEDDSKNFVELYDLFEREQGKKAKEGWQRIQVVD
ncbi:hypothetical protein AC579_116 [Pseudocercospora musae]|uniref:Uncharacterized protein n=1 Tax=Pseudocercospora musae TaxID=113226 RepID=A0A139ILM5_9PEZI|nr:hypothetical protein AC579_116 [Pseudocercospora musae]